MLLNKNSHIEEDGSVGYVDAYFDSSNILQSTYFPGKEKLVVTFGRGQTYAYFDVSQNLYERFENSESQGKFIRSEIIDKNLDSKLMYKLTSAELSELKANIELNKNKNGEV